MRVRVEVGGKGKDEGKLSNTYLCNGGVPPGTGVPVSGKWARRLRNGGQSSRERSQASA